MCCETFVKRPDLRIRYDDKPTSIQTVPQKADALLHLRQAAHGALDFKSDPLDATGTCIGAAILEQILDIEPDMSGQGF